MTKEMTIEGVKREVYAKYGYDVKLHHIGAVLGILVENNLYDAVDFLNLLRYKEE